MVLFAVHLIEYLYPNWISRSLSLKFRWLNVSQEDASIDKAS